MFHIAKKSLALSPGSLGLRYLLRSYCIRVPSSSGAIDRRIASKSGSVDFFLRRGVYYSVYTRMRFTAARLAVKDLI